MNEPLRQIAEGLWERTGEVAPAPGFRMSTRMTLLALPHDEGGSEGKDRDLLLISPIALDDEAAAAIDRLGRVRHLISPNLFHYFFLDAAARRWPEAWVWGAPGLTEKCGIPLHHELATGSQTWPSVDVFEIAGMPKFREHVLFHRTTGTLITTDLVFNRPHGHNFLTRMFFRVFGTYERFAVSRLFRSMIEDKAAFGDSLQPLLALPIDRVVMAHGEILEAGARDALQNLLEKSAQGV